MMARRDAGWNSTPARLATASTDGSGAAMTNPKRISYRAYLEVRNNDGTTSFCATEKILESPDLQKRCLEKKALRAIVNRLRKAGLLDERVLAPGSTSQH
jgi:hypothetical protein